MSLLHLFLLTLVYIIDSPCAFLSWCFALLLLALSFLWERQLCLLFVFSLSLCLRFRMASESLPFLFFVLLPAQPERTTNVLHSFPMPWDSDGERAAPLSFLVLPHHSLLTTEMVLTTLESILPPALSKQDMVSCLCRENSLVWGVPCLLGPPPALCSPGAALRCHSIQPSRAALYILAVDVPTPYKRWPQGFQHLLPLHQGDKKDSQED